MGAYFVKLEFQRYRRRQVLDRLLGEYPLLQFIVGVPAWACAALDVGAPTVLWTATTVHAERRARARALVGPRRWWFLLMTRVAQAYEQQALQHVEYTFALSPYTLDTLRRWMDPARCGVAYCVVDTELFRPGDPQAGRYILYVGRFSDARKNVPLLLRAYAGLAVRRPVPDLYVVGEPPSPPAWQIARQLRIQDRVRFVGYTSAPALAELYRGAQFFVLPSAEEGPGIVVLEAMASGLPVISTRSGGPETVLEEGVTGFITPVDDVSALAAAMERLLDNPGLRRTMGQAARQVAEARYALPVAGAVFLDKFEELLGSRG